MVVVDDDGAEEKYELELSVNSKPESNPQDNPKSNDAGFNLSALAVVIGIFAFSVFMFMRLKSPENVSGNLPKWNDAGNKESQSDKENSDDEDLLWE